MKPFWTNVFGAGAILAAGLVPVLGADYQASGTATFTTVDSDAVTFGSGAVKQRIRLKGVILADDPTNPLHLSAQDCGGSVVVAADGTAVNGGGYCEATDKDGDVWWLSWADYDGNGNTWTILGGTGKYEGISGGGTITAMMQSADGRLVNRWQGSWTMK
jgi:hypothetical protein